MSNKKDKLELFKKYNKDGYAIKGSWAIKIMFDDFKRIPNDIDLLMLDKNEDFDYRFNKFKDQGHIKDIKEKFDLFEWQDNGEKIEVALTVSAFSTIVHKYEGEDVVIENPLSILGQKTLSTIAFIYLNTMKDRQQNNEDILFLIDKYSFKDVTDEMIEHFIVDHFKLEQEKVSTYFVEGWKEHYLNLFNDEVRSDILKFLERVKTVASNNALYESINSKHYFDYKEWRSR